MLKYIAILSMLLDHINLYLFNREYEILTFIGRFAFPLFIFLSVRAYMFYTSNKEDYILRIFGFAYLTFVFVDLFDVSLFPVNILFSIALGLVAIYLIEKKLYIYTWIPFVLSMHIEYSFYGVLAFVTFYSFLNKRDIYTTILLLISLFLLNQPSDNYYLLIFLPLIFAEHYLKIDFKTTLNKYFFYLFYPVHLIILGVLK